MAVKILIAAAGLVVLGYIIDFVFSLWDDPREPPRLRPKIPVIGHVVGLMRHGPSYSKMTSEAAGTEIYTVGFLHYKVYMSASARLLPAFQKSARTLSFRPFIELTAHKFGDASPATHELYHGTLPDDLGRAIRSSLSPGPHLDYLNHQMGIRALSELDKMLDKGRNGHEPTISLLGWSRYTITEATSYAVYGENHPFVKRETVDAFWEWQHYLVGHLMGLDFTGKGYALRTKVFNEYIKYCARLPDDASHLMSEHQRVLRSAGVSDVDKAKQAAIFTVASFANSAPTLYWTLSELYSRPALLEEVRRDLVEAEAVSGTRETGFVLDVTALKARCALIVSVINETQRTRQINSSFRKVLGDTMLDGKYLLRKGNFIQVPGDIIHNEKLFWGDTAGEFDPRRFLTPRKRENGGAPSSASGFIAFGFAPYTCPARQFATTELLILVALFVMRADMSPVTGIWEMKAPVNTTELSTVPSPLKDVEMRVKVREEWAGEWSLKSNESLSEKAV